MNHKETSPMEFIRAVYLLLALFLLCLQAKTCVSIPTRMTAKQHHARFLRTTAARSAAWLAGAPANTSKVFNPVSYGADPTGVKDSSDAIIRALNDAFQVQKGVELLPGINDLGGVVIDLQGGNYKIDKPIRVPVSGIGNAVIQGGTLRASENFPMNEYLIELWSTSSARDFKPGGAVIYYEDITFRDILFDSSYLGGGLLIIDSARIRIDNCYFNHFGSEGILVSRGHEIYISSCFLGQHETVGGDPDERNFTGTAIDLASNDNSITDVAIFSAATGVILRGQANILTGVHCYNKATFWGGVGILVKLAGLGQTRIDNCYMDWTSIVMEDPAQVHVTNAFFLGNANIVLISIKGVISGLNIVDNMFSGSGGTTPIVALDETITPFTTIEQVVVDRNNVLDMQLKSTVARMSVAGKGTTWVADFSPMLVFPSRINHLQYSFCVGSGSPYKFSPHAVMNISNNRVTVGSKRVLDAVVSMEVDQYAVPGELSMFM